MVSKSFKTFSAEPPKAPSSRYQTLRCDESLSGVR
jgi:hypothetical protein